MSKLRVIKAFLFGLLAVIVISCGEYRRLQKSDDWKAKFEGAMRYYEEGDYFRAISLFEEVLPVTRGKAEDSSAIINTFL